MPRIGCGLAGGEWSVVEPIIISTLCANNIPVYVYDFDAPPDDGRKNNRQRYHHHHHLHHWSPYCSLPPDQPSPLSLALWNNQWSITDQDKLKFIWLKKSLVAIDTITAINHHHHHHHQHHHHVLQGRRSRKWNRPIRHKKEQHTSCQQTQSKKDLITIAVITSTIQLKAITIIDN